MKANRTLDDADDCNKRMDTVLASKGLDINMDKSVFIAVGNKQFKSKFSR